MAFAKITFGDTTIEIPDRKWSDKNCQMCKEFELCDETHLLQCKICGKFSSPYNFLHSRLGKLGLLGVQLRRLKAEIKLKSEILERLKRDEQNTRARIRNIKRNETTSSTA